MNAFGGNGNEQLKIKCDECGFEFGIEDVDIRETRVECDQEVLTVLYFVCRRCDHVYTVCLKDDQFAVLESDLEDARRRIKKLWGNASEEQIKTAQRLAEKKLKRLQVHQERLKEKFPGAFTVTRVEGTEFLAYEP